MKVQIGVGIDKLCLEKKKKVADYFLLFFKLRQRAIPNVNVPKPYSKRSRSDGFSQ